MRRTTSTTSASDARCRGGAARNVTRWNIASLCAVMWRIPLRKFYRYAPKAAQPRRRLCVKQHIPPEHSLGSVQADATSVGSIQSVSSVILRSGRKTSSVFFRVKPR